MLEFFYDQILIFFKKKPKGHRFELNIGFKSVACIFETRFRNKPGTAQVGAISNAQK